MNEVYNAMLKRRSIRKYQERPVEEEKIHTLLEAAMAAPSACNNQPWEFVVVTDAALLEQFRQNLRYAGYNAPLAIVVCDNPRAGKAPECEDYWIQDCSAALENILVCAASLDLGSVWIGVYPRQEKIDTLRSILGIPAHVTPLGIVYAGYPAETRAPRTQFEAGRVHRQMYGQH